MGEPNLTDQQWKAVEAALAGGKTDEAVGYLREFTGCSLPEARDILHNYDKEAWAEPPEGLSVEQRREINRLLAERREEEAARLVRGWTNLDEAGAKKFIERQYAALEKLDPVRFPGGERGM